MLKQLRNRRGFTLIELMIVITVVGILAAISVPSYKLAVIKAREAVLKEQLYNFVTVIDQYYADKGKYPDTLQQLVEGQYMRDIPKDPFTLSKDSWVTIMPPAPAEGTGDEVKGSVFDVRSGSNKVGTNGIPYNEWTAFM